MVIRKASMADRELLVQMRLDYLQTDLGSFSEETKTQLRQQLRPYFEQALAAGNFLAVIAEENGQVLSTAYLAIGQMPPSPASSNGRVGTLLNVLTYPQYRRQGLATKVLTEVLAEAKAAEVSYVQLSATESGKTVYEKLGFLVSHYTSMNLKL